MLRAASLARSSARVRHLTSLQQPTVTPWHGCRAAAVPFSSSAAPSSTGSTAAGDDNAAAAPASSPVVSLQFPESCQTPLPAGTSVLRTWVKPLPPPPLTESERARIIRASVEPVFGRLNRLAGEFEESLVRKLTEPHKVIWEAYGAIWTQWWNRWSRRIGYITKIMRQCIHTEVPRSDGSTAMMIVNASAYVSAHLCLPVLLLLQPVPLTAASSSGTRTQTCRNSPC
jgi:hypothetical protein